MRQPQSMAVSESLATAPSSTSQPGRISSSALFLVSSAGMDLALLTMVFVSVPSLFIFILQQIYSLVFWLQEKSFRFWFLVSDPLASSIYFRLVMVSWGLLCSPSEFVWKKM
jgi:hypothetical protein